jgi:hypothetical protein
MIAVISFIDGSCGRAHSGNPKCTIHATPGSGFPEMGSEPFFAAEFGSGPISASPRAPTWRGGRGTAHTQRAAGAAGLACRRVKACLGLRAMAFDPRLIDDLARRLAGSVPEGMQALRRDLEQNFKGVLQAGLAKFDLVTREEFDVQTAVLRRTREKLTELEQRLRELEGGD